MIREEPIILGENLSIGYLLQGKKSRVVHDPLNFSIFRGELTCLLGSNGTGKSTLLKTIAGLIKPLKGNLKIMGKALSAYHEEELSRVLSIVLTGRTHAGGLSVYEIVALGRYPYTGYFGKLSDTDHQVIRDVLIKTGIENLSGVLTAELSDGERQKVMIAKALAQESPVILLDEPTAYLDLASRMEIMDLLRNLAAKENKAILLSTHDLETALKLADRLWLLSPENPLIQGLQEDLAIQGILSEFFTNSRMDFDTLTGSFRLNYENPEPVSIQGREEDIHWIANALARNGFYTGNSGQKARISIEARENRQYILSLKGKPAGVFTSVEALLHEINRLK